MTDGAASVRGQIRLVHGVVSTDDILPARHKHRTVDPNEMGRWIFEHYDPELRSRLTRGDGLLADDTFGIGSSREQAVSALLSAGVSFVIAPCFGRIFFRNAWNLGLPAIEVDGISATEGEIAQIDLAAGSLTISATRHRIARVHPRLLNRLQGGGLLQVLAREHLTAN